MPVIENNSEHPFHFIAPNKPDKDGNVVPAVHGQGDITFPRAGNPRDDGSLEPSRTEVTGDQLEAMRKHRVAKAWFGRRALTVANEESPKAKATA